MMDAYKICSACDRIFPATVEFFGSKRGQCKKCLAIKNRQYKEKNKERIKIKSKQYRYNNRKQLKINKKQYSKKNRERLRVKHKKYNDKNKERIKQYYLNNKKRIAVNGQQYRKDNQNKLKIAKKLSYIKNKKQILLYQAQYNKNNQKKIAARSKQYRKNNQRQLKQYWNNPSRYNSLSFQGLAWLNQTRKAPDGDGEITCAYCGEWMIPTKSQVKAHVAAINNSTNSTMSRIYCSESCKEACPTYRQREYPKGFKKASSREVNPLIRQMCFEYDDYECQKCGATQEDDQLHCHHIKGAVKEPLLANDIDNVITLCKTCHGWVHSQIGCGYADYRRPECVEA